METLKEKSTYIESVVLAALICLNVYLNHFFNTIILYVGIVLGIVNVPYLMLIRKQYGNGQKHLWVLLLGLTILYLISMIGYLL